MIYRCMRYHLSVINVSFVWSENLHKQNHTECTLVPCFFSLGTYLKNFFIFCQASFFLKFFLPSFATPLSFLAFWFFSFIHMCIQCLGHFSSLPPASSFPSPPYSLASRQKLFLSLILLKREYKQQHLFVNVPYFTHPCSYIKKFCLFPLLSAMN
jgi:hypothetical protein